MSEAAFALLALMGSETPIKILAVVGAATLGALLSGVVVGVLVKLAFAQKLPPWPAWIVRVLGGGLFGFLVYLWLFGGGGGGIGGPGGWFGGSGKDGAHTKEGSSEPRPKDKDQQIKKEKDKEKEKKDREKDKDGKSTVPPGESLQVEVLGSDALKKIGRSDTVDTVKCYRIKGKPQLLSLAEVQNLIRDQRKGKPGLRKLEIFVYLDSPATDKPQVADLESWARDVDPQSGKLEVEVRAPDRYAPVD